MAWWQSVVGQAKIMVIMAFDQPHVPKIEGSVVHRFNVTRGKVSFSRREIMIGANHQLVTEDVARIVETEITVMACVEDSVGIAGRMKVNGQFVRRGKAVTALDDYGTWKPHMSIGIIKA